MAISQVIRLMKNPEYAQFRCVVFDTAPTGHTLRLLTLPDFLNTGVGKIVRLRFTIANALSGLTSFFTGKSGKTVDQAVEKLEQLQARPALLVPARWLHAWDRSATPGCRAWTRHVARRALSSALNAPLLWLRASRLPLLWLQRGARAACWWAVSALLRAVLSVR